jgi:acetoin utilization deacetylase AcuC-like enzyme
MKPTGIVRDPTYLTHDMGAYHPECPQRLEVIYSMLDELAPFLNITEIPSRDALLEEIAANHDPRYVSHVASTAGKEETFLDPDTSACAKSWEAASRAVGGLFNLLDAVMEGAVRNGFALIRPPGHHAERRRAMGFCFFNNVALGARHAINKYGLERVAIVDWDLHHGNGTQNSFYEDPKVLFASLHQYPHYPGTGSIREVGHGPGEGYTVNIPLAAGAGDMEYLSAFHLILAPILEAYKPQLILVSAGFDAHCSDPLGGMSLTEDGYEQMLQILMHLSAEYCGGKLVLTLEGGYNLGALRDSVSRIMTTLCSYDPGKENVPLQPNIDSLASSFKNRLKDILYIQGRHWPNLPKP